MCGWGPYAREASVWEACCRYSGVIIMFLNCLKDVTGTWSFEIRAEMRSCHFAHPPAASEQADFLVVEAGRLAFGAEAGLRRVHDPDWHRVSFFEPRQTPVVVSQIQSNKSRIQFATTRQQFSPGVAADIFGSHGQPYHSSFPISQTTLLAPPRDLLCC